MDDCPFRRFGECFSTRKGGREKPLVFFWKACYNAFIKEGCRFAGRRGIGGSAGARVGPFEGCEPAPVPGVQILLPPGAVLAGADP